MQNEDNQKITKNNVDDTIREEKPNDDTKSAQKIKPTLLDYLSVYRLLIRDVIMMIALTVSFVGDLLILPTSSMTGHIVCVAIMGLLAICSFVELLVCREKITWLILFFGLLIMTVIGIIIISLISTVTAIMIYWIVWIVIVYVAVIVVNVYEPCLGFIVLTPSVPFFIVSMILIAVY